MKAILLFLILGIGFGLQAMAATLVASYSFEGNTNDLSGSGNHAVNYGAAFVAGISGQALRFDGNDFVRAADSASLDIPGSISLAAWVKTSVPGTEYVSMVAKHYTHNNRSYGLFLTDTMVGYSQFDNASNSDYDISDNVALNNGQWHYVASTYNATTGDFKLFVDGALRTSENVGSHTLMNSSVPLIMGAYGLSADGYTNRGFLVGDLDEVRVYNGVLTDTEITILYNSYSIPEPHSIILLILATASLWFRQSRRAFSH